MNKITIYSKPNCPQCRMAKYVLENENIDFEEKDITKDDETLNFIMEQGFMTVPVILAEGHDPIVGFQPEKIKSLKL